jgi:hypothetical protein
MSKQGRPAPRKPATKFAHLRKKMQKSALRTKVDKLRPRKT